MGITTINNFPNHHFFTGGINHSQSWVVYYCLTHIIPFIAKRLLLFIGFFWDNHPLIILSGWWYTYPSEKYDFVSWGYYSHICKNNQNSYKMGISSSQPYWYMGSYGSVSKPCTPSVHFKIAGIYECSSP